MLILAFLWVNEFPDYAADRSAAKNNLVVRLGRQRASRLLPLIYGSGFGVLLILPFFGYSAWVLLGFAALPTAVFACVYTWRAPETFYRHHPVQAAALVSFVVYALGAAAGYLIPGL